MRYSDSESEDQSRSFESHERSVRSNTWLPVLRYQSALDRPVQRCQPLLEAFAETRAAKRKSVSRRCIAYRTEYILLVLTWIPDGSLVWKEVVDCHLPSLVWDVCAT